MITVQRDSQNRVVTLREISASTVRQVTDLVVHETQQPFVASNAVSLAQALFTEEAWYRAIYCDESLAGFVMLYDETLKEILPPTPKVTLWRFMIDATFQRQGVGNAALNLIIDHVRSKGIFSRITTSYVPGPGGPEGFYLSQGFYPTGETEEGEVILERILDS